MFQMELKKWKIKIKKQTVMGEIRDLTQKKWNGRKNDNWELEKNWNREKSRKAVRVSEVLFETASIKSHITSIIANTDN